MVQTPWGNVEELRSRRLRPGPGGSREGVATNQRERLFAAMVGAVVEHGYAATRVADVVALSGVSRSAFYKYFRDKEDCFFAMLDAFAAMATERVAEAYAAGGSWEDRLRAAASALLELTIAQPAVTRVWLVDAYAAGPEAMERIDRVAGTVERALQAALAESPERADVPRDVVRGIVGGIRKAVHTRLRRGDEADLERILPELLDWALSYESPPRQLRRPRRRPDRGAAPPKDTKNPTERLIAAVTDTVAERGYSNTTIVEIADRASASLSTFYANFATKEEAFLASVERARRDTIAAAVPAVVTAPDWPHGVRDGLDALFGFLAAEPEVASVGVLDSFAAGPRALESSAGVVESFHAFLEPGFERAPRTSPIAAEAIGGAIFALVYSEVRRGRVERMRELTPTAAFIALAPFTGASEACAVANEPLRGR